MPAIDSLETKLSDLREQADTYLERDDFDPADPGYKAITDEAERLTRAIKEQSDWTARKANADESTALVRAAKSRADAAAATATADPGMTAGELFTRSAQFGAYHGYGASGRVDVGDTLTRAISLPMKEASFATALLAGAQFQAPASLLTPALDLIPTVNTSLSAFPVWGVEIKEGGAAVVPEGDAKPPLELELAKIDVSLDMVAVYTQVTRQALEDIAMLRSVIDVELQRSVLRKFEELAVAAIMAATIPTAQSAAGSQLTAAIRLGIAKVQTAGWTPNAVAINPDDAAAVDIAALSNAAACCTDGYFGLTVVPVPGLTAGTAIVGDWSNGARTYANSSGVSLFITDSHADTFIHNVFTVLAETRRDTVITRPDAFAKVSVTP